MLNALLTVADLRAAASALEAAGTAGDDLAQLLRLAANTAERGDHIVCIRPAA